MRAGRRSASDLHVKRRLALQQSIFLEQVAADFGQALGRIFTRKRDPDSLETPPQPLIVETSGERTSVDYAENLIYAVAENKSAILNRNSRLCSWDKSAVYVNDIFGCHMS